MADPSLHHISLTCDDPIAVERFYTRHFGFRRARVVDIGQGAQIVFLRGAGTLLELFRAAEPNPVGARRQEMAIPGRACAISRSR